MGSVKKYSMYRTETEISRLLDIIPASGRMLTKIVSKPEQTIVIEVPFPLPWSQKRPILINFDLWHRLPTAQRDLLILRTISWLLGIKWFKLDWYQGVVLAGLVGGIVELLQGDAVGVVVATGLSALASAQIWQSSHSSQSQLEADEVAIKIAQRRGYSQSEATQHLLSAIATVARIEGRSSLNFTELIRCQNLRAIAGISPMGVPDAVKRQGK